MWVTGERVPSEGVEVRLFQESFLLEPVRDGVRFRQRNKQEWIPLRVIGVESTSLKYSVLPRPYELPTFVQLTETLDVYPKRTMNFFVQVPFKASLSLESSAQILELISLERSSPKQIWDGDVTSMGNLCYYTISPIEEAYSSTNGEVPLVPVRLLNPTEEVQSVERITIDTRYLAVYQRKDGLVTDLVEATLMKGGEMSISYLSEISAELSQESTRLCAASASQQTSRIISPLKKLRSIF